MNYKYNIFLVVIISFFCTACAENVKRYKMDASFASEIQTQRLNPTELISVTMPKGDGSSTMCRLQSTISLPNNMKYSSYIQDALQKTLSVINYYSSNSTKSPHRLQVKLTNVSLNSVTAKWCISGEITVNDNITVSINTIYNYNMAYLASVACSNAAGAFDEAVEQFIKEIFSHPQILKQLRK